MDDRLKSEDYKSILTDYLSKQDETTLYRAQKLSREWLEGKVSPEEIIHVHIDTLQSIFPDMPSPIKHSLDFLLEIMIGYGLAYREHQSLRNKQFQLQSEISVAANMQDTLLKTDNPNVSSLDIGVISIPARKMNGDYYHFVQDKNDCIGVAIADVIGKGIPAALCMSMIKYSMDSFPDAKMEPKAVLENLNRVVEYNVDPSMFITMFYGMYDPRIHRFYYAGAGHEPGFYYHANEDRFEELTTKGIVLGVSRDTEYKEFERNVEVGDMIVLLTDGVTECRSEDHFVERDQIVKLIRKNINKAPQEIVENVYQELERFQNFELRDDFTLIILKRKF